MVKLEQPKEEIMEVLPFIIAVASYLCIQERISEKITLILEVHDEMEAVLRLTIFAFNLLNGVELP